MIWIILPNFTVQKARKKPLEKKTASDLGVDISGTVQLIIEHVSEPPTRQAGVIVDDVDSLLAKLKEQGHLLK